MKGVDVHPADIDGIAFKTTRIKEGYDPDEVDDFLDRVSQSWRQTLDENKERGQVVARLTRELAEARNMLDAYGELETQVIPTPPPAESATRILEFAQRTADAVMAEASEKADELLAATRNQCDSMKNEARSVVYQNEQMLKELQAKQGEIREFLKSYLRRQMNELEDTGG